MLHQVQVEMEQGVPNHSAQSCYIYIRNLEGIDYLILPNVFEDKTHCDEILDRLFKVIIKAGVTSFSMAVRYDNTLTATTFLKWVKNYYAILGDHWLLSLREEIGNILDNAV